MVRASTRPEGVTAPVESGLSSQDRMKRTSSSKRGGFFSRTRSDCEGIMRDAGDGTVMSTGKTPCPRGQALPAWLYSGGVRMVPETVEKFLDLGEEPRGFRVGLPRGL